METKAHSHEVAFRPQSAWTYVVGLPLGALAVWSVAPALREHWWYWTAAGLVSAGLLVCGFGFFIVNPNRAKVLVLFGRYRGTVRNEGFYWTNPFTIRHSMSLRAHNVASEKIKVNDQLGNPIEIGAVIVWRVRDTAQACFDV